MDGVKIKKGLHILWERLSEQGPKVTALWVADHWVRALTGAPLRALTEVAPGLHVGGQYRRRGWARLAARGITAVVNMRDEWDDQALGIAPQRYLYLPTVDDMAPSLEDLRRGVTFIQQERGVGGGVYIHCGAGVGRAAAMAAAYLVSTGLTADEAWARLRQVRPFVRPKPVQVVQVARFAREALRV
ncbi:MAG: protein phosphatase [Chloroflexi bacterium]|nr:protein phosphatase [Chloroflexota bacterium]